MTYFFIDSFIHWFIYSLIYWSGLYVGRIRESSGVLVQLKMALQSILGLLNCTPIHRTTLWNNSDHFLQLSDLPSFRKWVALLASYWTCLACVYSQCELDPNCSLRIRLGLGSEDVDAILPEENKEVFHHSVASMFCCPFHQVFKSSSHLDWLFCSIWLWSLLVFSAPCKIAFLNNQIIIRTYSVSLVVSLTTFCLTVQLPEASYQISLHT